MCTIHTRRLVVNDAMKVYWRTTDSKDLSIPQFRVIYGKSALHSNWMGRFRQYHMALPPREDGSGERSPEYDRETRVDVLSIQIDNGLLEQACKEIIETILYCLPNAHKGTVYRIGPPPSAVAERITSGIMGIGGEIAWGLPENSDYNPPGKPWLDYRDEPGRPLEAMAWCVEQQKSWTADNPGGDNRSVRLQVEGVDDDFHHMEPVLIRKEDLYAANDRTIEYPRNYNGETIWKGSDYVVVAVVKIHFRPHTIKVGGPETKMIGKLSRALGTELLSYQLRQESLEVMRRTAEDRIDSCNIVADSLRNAIAKTGLILSLIKLELGYVRRDWERSLLEGSHKEDERLQSVRMLNEAALEAGGDPEECDKLIQVQNKLLDFSLPPELGEKWVHLKIESRWDSILATRQIDEGLVAKIREGLRLLEKSIHICTDPEMLVACENMPEQFKAEWADVVTKSMDGLDMPLLDRYIGILSNRELKIPYREKARRSLQHLQALAMVMTQLESDTNLALKQILNGNGNGGFPFHPQCAIHSVSNG